MPGPGVKEVEIHTPWIELGRFLKWSGQAETGGQARAVIAQNLVKVNGITETRFGRRLVPGDRVEVIHGGQFLVVPASGRS